MRVMCVKEEARQGWWLCELCLCENALTFGR